MYDTNQPRFLNAVVQADTQLTPEALLLTAKAVEQALGRQQRTRFGPREIDVDILLYGAERRDTPELTIPHPHMHERPFVQAPLAELRGETARASTGVRIVEGPEWGDA
jgi:2-amino-4-hydroxy-6-hydroxymethyldihydropteridine diphosphokinase